MDARIYARVSTEEQAVSGFSLSAQRERMEAFCLSQGWNIAGKYIDEGVSAKDLNRPEFQRMMDESETGDVVLVYKLDRLTRSVRDLDDLLKEFERRGIKFRSVTEQFDTTTATGRLFIRMVAEMAQWERETIAERTSFGKRKRAAEGEWNGGQVVFGYAMVPSDKMKAGRTLMKLVPDPERAHLVQMIFEKYLAGNGTRSIAVWLNNELGVRTPRGAAFSAVTVRRMLTNPFYCGDVEYGRDNKRIRMRVPGHHPPLVTREAFQRVQDLLEVHKLSAPRQATGLYPLSGVARCGICGGRIDGHHSHGRRVYCCHSNRIGRGCAPKGVRSINGQAADSFEKSLAEEIERLHQDPVSLDRLLAEYASQRESKAGMTQAERSRIEQDLVRAEAAVDRWKRLFENGHVADEEYLAEVQPHKDRIRQLKERLAENRAQEVTIPPREDFVAFALDFRESWESLEPPEQKALLQRLVQAFKVQILMYPDLRVEIRPAL